ncbi:MAG: hypothetical protein NT167_25835 [Verrucomicrobia bacterium]|nr:hypothetical protein [Verrucomicrobiota bacterium]
MRTIKTFLAVLLVSSATSYGGLYFNSAPGATIPDGNPDGYQNSISVSGLGSVTTSVLVYLNISGGCNGDLYAYLNYGGTSVLLLNRIGSSSGNPFGSASAGFGNGTHSYENGAGNWYSFMLADSGTSGLHSYTGTDGSPIIGSYQPDALSGTSLASFNGADPNGNWTIFFADMAGGPAGTSSSTLAGWGLEITAVPEPVNVALGIFGGVLLVGVIVRNPRVRDRLHRCRAAIVQWVDAV